MSFVPTLKTSHDSPEIVYSDIEKGKKPGIGRPRKKSQKNRGEKNLKETCFGEPRKKTRKTHEKKFPVN